MALSKIEEKIKMNILRPNTRIQSVKTGLIYRVLQLKITGVVKCAPECDLNATIYFLGDQLQRDFVIIEENIQYE